MTRFLLFPLALFATTCTLQEPGTPLGTYAITGTLATQTCGASMQSQIEAPWDFDVRLTRSGSILYWLQAAAPALSGVVDPSGNVTITTTQEYDVSSSADGGVFCSVMRTDTFVAALGTAADPSDFTATLAYHYELADGASCDGQLAGQFDVVPCDVSYVLAAKRSGP